MLVSFVFLFVRFALDFDPCIEMLMILNGSMISQLIAIRNIISYLKSEIQCSATVGVGRLNHSSEQFGLF